MGNKGDKKSGAVDLAAEMLVDRLQRISGITSKKMFGGYGIFHDGNMFGIIDSSGIAHLMANDESRVDFEKGGGHKHSRMPYYSIPGDVLDNDDKLIEWAIRSIAINK